MKSYIKIFLFITAFLFIEIPFLNSQSFADKSVLAEGEWFKIGVLNSGVYKLDYNFIKKTNLLKNNADPRHLQIYGNGGAMIPQANNRYRIDDLLENSIYIEGENDGFFDKGDYILFYAQGPHVPVFNEAEESITVAQNIYSDTSYYFITFGKSHGKRIPSLEALSGGQEITSYDEFIYHEVEGVNILATTIMQASESGSGRDWFGEEFDFTPKRVFNLNMEGILPGSTVNIFSGVLGCSSTNSAFNLKLNNQQLGLHTLPGLVEGVYNLKGVKDDQLFSINNFSTSNPANVPLEYSFTKGANSNAKGFLDFFIVNYKKKLSFYNTSTNFRSYESLNYPVSRFKIENYGSRSIIWDITDFLHPKSITFQVHGNVAEFSSSTDQLKEFVAFNSDKVSVPFSFGRIANQNLHGISSPHLVIITHPLFINEAKRLADFREAKDGLSVSVVTPQQIYNEFSSGMQDISAIRDFLRMLYLKEGKLKYALLFGDCSYDYKYRLSNNTNFVPIYESRESLHPIKSYSSDDFYGFMEENEGEWSEDSEGDHTLEIGVGRIPCKTIEDAHYAVEKIIYYSSNNKTLGNWKNRITFVADDGDANTHLFDADRLATKLDTTYGFINLKKIYLDAFPQESSPNVTSVKTREAIHEAVKLGTFILNYTGHGGESGWTNEKILETSQIGTWSNKEKLPLIVTATCEFGKYDDPRQISGSEVALFNPKGGAIALVTTTRPVFSSTNYILNKAFYEAAFTKLEGRMPTLGQIMIYTKNHSLNGSINRNFALIGDPSLTLSYPGNSIEIEKINGIEPSAFQDTLKALSEVSIKGVVANDMGIRNNFNGIIQVVVFDKPNQNQTLGNENAKATYTNTENALFKGNFSVKGGGFSFTFTLPKNINYKYGPAKISFYAYDDNQLEDAKGVLSDILLGGSVSTFPGDDIPPQISLFLNDSTFKNGDKVQTNPILKALIADESGINITSTVVGQDLKAFLTLNETKEIILNDFFEPEVDNFKKGFITYPLENLKPGNYTLTLKAWDINNNSNQAAIDFTVIRNKSINIKELYNFPNPFSEAIGTTFYYSHDRVGEDIEVTINIFSKEGQLIKSVKRVIYKSEENVSDLKWDGKGDFGNKISDGVYVYTIEVRSLSDKNKSYKSQKLLLIN